MTLKANTRMYNVTPEVQRLWTDLVGHAARRAELDIQLIDHPPPEPIEALWGRGDLALVLMCGWPFWRRAPRPEPIAAPLLDAPGVGAVPVYWTDMIVRADAPARRLEDTFGGTLAWTLESSHSGYNAPRHLLLHYIGAHRAPLYAHVVPNVVTPRGAIDAVLSGRADVAPLDGYYYLLLRRHAPDLASELRVVAQTAMAPMPLFTASHGTDPARVARLRAAMEALHEMPAAAALLDALSIRRFARIDLHDYALGDRWDAEARAAGYPAPA
ncbi:MAG: PhnD/SsuA/transferrin family substrate-binding protein [Pseudomonadota bacterium]